MNAGFLQDNEGNSSMVRLGFSVWVIGVFLMWAYVVIATKGLPDLPQGVLGALFVAFAGKVAQKHAELNAAPPDAPKA